MLVLKKNEVLQILEVLLCESKLQLSYETLVV